MPQTLSPDSHHYRHVAGARGVFRVQHFRRGACLVASDNVRVGTQTEFLAFFISLSLSFLFFDGTKVNCCCTVVCRFLVVCTRSASAPAVCLIEASDWYDHVLILIDHVRNGCANVKDKRTYRQTDSESFVVQSAATYFYRYTKKYRRRCQYLLVYIHVCGYRAI